MEAFLESDSGSSRSSAGPATLDLEQTSSLVSACKLQSVRMLSMSPEWITLGLPNPPQLGYFA